MEKRKKKDYGAVGAAFMALDEVIIDTDKIVKAKEKINNLTRDDIEAICGEEFEMSVSTLAERIDELIDAEDKLQILRLRLRSLHDKLAARGKLHVFIQRRKAATIE